MAGSRASAPAPADPSGPPAVRVYGVLALAVLTIGGAAIATRLADAPGVLIAAGRMSIAATLLAPWALRGLLASRARRAPRAGRPARGAWIYAVLAGLFLAAHFATFLTSLFYTSVAASVALVTATPLWVALLSWGFLGLRPTAAVVGGVLAAVGGSALIGFGDAAGGSGPAPLFGDALALIGGFCVSVYLLFGRAAQRRGLGLDAYSGIAYGVAAVALLPLPALFGIPWSGWGASTWGWIAALALGPQLVGHTGINYAMQHLDPTRVSTLILLEPAIAGVLAWILFAEVPTPATLTGVAMLLAGVAAAIRSAPAAPVPPAPPA